MDSCANTNKLDSSVHAVDRFEKYTYQPLSCSRRLLEMRSQFWMCTVSALITMLMFQPASGQTLDEVQTDLLFDFCADLKGEDAQNFFANAGSELLDLCSPGGPGGTPGAGASSSGGGAAGTQNTFVTIARRLSKARGSKENEPNGGGAGDEIATVLGNGLGLFLSGQFEGLDRTTTRFETGYKSTVNGVTGGVDYRFADWLVAGIAANYNHWDGNFNNAGGFNTDSLSPILYLSFAPAENVFADIMLEYTHQWRDRERFSSFSDRETTVNASGIVSSDYETNRYGANAVLGYDHSIGPFTIGPRFRFRYSDLNINNYTETGNTGLELRFLRDRVTSLQTAVGLQASGVFSTSFGVVVPQISADWTHEFQNTQRNMSAQFVQDGRSQPTTFQFQSDKPDRDFFHVGTGVGLVLPNGIQPFVNFEALLGNSMFDNFVGTVGIRVEN